MCLHGKASQKFQRQAIFYLMVFQAMLLANFLLTYLILMTHLILLTHLMYWQDVGPLGLWNPMTVEVYSVALLNRPHF